MATYFRKNDLRASELLSTDNRLNFTTADYMAYYKLIAP